MPSAVDLARFRRRQLLRILLRDVLGVATLVRSHRGTVQPGRRHPRRRLPPHPRANWWRTTASRDSKTAALCGFSVISLGKLGGKELNYSSDIDLMFVYGGNGETDGPRRLTNKEFYKKIANQYTALLSTYTAEGQCYRVDLRLRPDGTLGEICISDEGARRLLQSNARATGKSRC